jgi:hypothetical protein
LELFPPTVFWLVLFFVFVPVLFVGLSFEVFAMVVQEFLRCCCQMNAIIRVTQLVLLVKIQKTRGAHKPKNLPFNAVFE